MIILTYSFPMHPFSTPWKHQKTLRFSDVFNGVQKGCIGKEWVNYFSHHQEYIKQNIAYNLAKRIIVFVFDEAKMNERLSEIKTWFLSCSYHLAIEQSFFNAKLQGPAPKKEESYSVEINTL